MIGNITEQKKTKNNICKNIESICFPKRNSYFDRYIFWKNKFPFIKVITYNY